MEPTGNKRKLRSKAWNYFVPSSDRKSGTCKLCPNNNVISTPAGSTSSLSKHLQNVHSIVINVSLKRPSQHDEDEIDVPELVARFAASDGMPFSTIANSVPMRLLLQRSGCLTVPKSGNGIREIMTKFYRLKRNEAIDYLKAATASGRKFSISLDEWTSTANRRYLNVNVHSGNGQFLNLGLVRLKGSISSKACEDYVKLKLAEFGLSFKRDIVCISTDGAAVMKKLGRISGKQQQLCMAHGLHLAVMDVLYRREDPTEESSDSEEMESGNGMENATMEEEDDDDSSSFTIETVEESSELDFRIGEIVKKVRRVVKIFTNSALKEEKLKGYVKVSFPNTDISVILDVRTRWSSLYLMLERFMLLRNDVQKALIDLNESILVSDGEFEFIEELVRILKPVKCVVEAICKQNATLTSCDIALDMMMNEIRKKETVLSMQIYEALKIRILQRRSPLADVLKYLAPKKRRPVDTHRSAQSIEAYPEYFKSITKAQLIKIITDLAKVLFEEYATEEPANSHVINSDDLFENFGEIAEPRDFEVELYDAINLAHASIPTLDLDKSLSGTVKKEMALWESTGSKGKILCEIFNVLMTIPPTSVEPERAFSSAGYLCSKIRSRMSDSTLDALVFLRSYFRSK